MLKSLAKDDSALHDHLNKPEAKNATYLSPRSQNEIISVIGYDVIRANIISEVKEAMFLLMKSAATMLFVDKSFNVREEFVAFVKLPTVDIANAIISTLEESGLSLRNLRGQGYDGAATMSGEKSNVQKQL